MLGQVLESFTRIMKGFRKLSYWVDIPLCSRVSWMSLTDCLLTPCSEHGYNHLLWLTGSPKSFRSLWNFLSHSATVLSCRHTLTNLIRLNTRVSLVWVLDMTMLGETKKQMNSQERIFLLPFLGLSWLS